MEQEGEGSLEETEMSLGEHVTGGVIQSWRTVLKKLRDVLSEGKLNRQRSPAKVASRLSSRMVQTSLCLQVELLRAPTTTNSWLR